MKRNNKILVMKRNPTLKKVIAVIVALCLLVAAFFCGYGVKSCNTNYSLEWAVNTIYENYYTDEELTKADIYDAYMHGEINDVLDQYSAYYTEEEYAQLVSSNGGSKSGVGISYSYVEEGKCSFGSGILIHYAVGNSPAKKAGIEAGTFLSGGSSGETYVRSESRTEFTSTDSFATFISGFDAGEKFTLYDADGSSYYTLSKEEYTASYAYMYTNSAYYYFEDNESGGDLQLKARSIVGTGKVYNSLPDKAAYIRLDQFYGSATQEMIYLINEFNTLGCTSLILDLRDNGGGYVSVMQNIAGLFTSATDDRGGIAMKAVYKSGKEEVERMTVYEADGDYVFKAGVDVKVLADDGTASASEALIGALISYGIIDYDDIYISDYSQATEYKNYYDIETTTCRTYGKGIMQSTFVNSSTGEALKLTTAKIYWDNGKCIHGVGITTSDGANALPASWDVDFNSIQLRAAISTIYPDATSSF